MIWAGGPEVQRISEYAGEIPEHPLAWVSSARGLPVVAPKQIGSSSLRIGGIRCVSQAKDMLRARA